MPKKSVNLTALSGWADLATMKVASIASYSGTMVELASWTTTLFAE